jgi:hypothetical protein
VFPLLRRSCLPAGSLPTAINNQTETITFAVTSVHLPVDGPGHWSDGEREMLALSERNRERYCRRHGHTCYNGTKWAENNYDNVLSAIQGRERGVWFKPLYLRELLVTNNATTTDWILYMDTDAMIVNEDFILVDLLRGVEPSDGLIATMDAEGVNSGVLLIRTNDMGKMIVNAWAEGHRSASTVMNDQDYLTHMFDNGGYIKEEYIPVDRDGGVSGRNGTRPRMKIVTQCSMQSGGGLERRHGSLWPHFDGTYARGDFIVHFFGRPDKLEQMRLVEEGSLGFWSR